MNLTRMAPIAALAACPVLLTTMSAQAQSAATAAPRAQNTTAAASARPALPASVTPDPAVVRELEKIIVPKLELKNADSQQALMALIEPLEVGYEFDNAFYVSGSAISLGGVFGAGMGVGFGGGQTLDLPPRSITMRLVKAPLNKALDSLTNAIGIGWLAEKHGDSITVRFVKLRGTVTASDMLSRYVVASGQAAPWTPSTSGNTVYSGTAGTFSTAGVRGGLSGFGGVSPLAATAVKLDVRDRPVREALRTVLEAAKVDFAIDEDVPADMKRTFAFEGVQAATALSVICQSAGLGWRTEQTPNGLLVRIGKRYAPPPPAPKADSMPGLPDPALEPSPETNDGP